MIELKRFVERVVRPIDAECARKLRMREELYAHLLDAYEYERRETADDALALQQAQMRMGDPEQLRADLQATVPKLERWVERWGKFFLRRPGESYLAFAGRIAMIAFALILFDMLLTLPMHGQDVLAWNQEGRITVRFLVALTTGFTFSIFCLAPLASKTLGLLKECTSWREQVRPLSLMAGGCFVVLLIAGMTCHLFAAGDWSVLRTALGYHLPIALVGAVLGACCCLAALWEYRRAEPWLEINLES